MGYPTCSCAEAAAHGASSRRDRARPQSAAAAAEVWREKLKVLGMC